MSSLLALRSAGGVTIGDALLLGSAVMVAFTAVGRGVVRPSPKIQVAVTLLVIAGGLGAYRSLSIPADLGVTVRLVYLVGVLPWQAKALTPDVKALERSARYFVAGAAVCGAATLLQARFGAGIIPGTTVTSSGRFSGLAQTVSDTGGITTVALVFCLAGLGARADRRSQYLSLVFLTASGVGLLLSGSVSGLLAAAAAVLYLLVRRRLSARRLLVMVGAAFVVLQVVGLVQHNTNGALTPIQRIEQATGLAKFSVAQAGLNTSQSRLDTDRAGLHGFLEHPVFGAGLDSASGIVDQADNFQVHNLVIGAAYQGGAVLVIALMIPILMALRQGWIVARRSVIAGQIYAGLLTAVVFSLTAPSDYNRYFWIPVALVVCAHDVHRREPEAVSPPITRTGAATQRPLVYASG